ncbi:AraC family transcriptional regulator [Kordiimonas sp. SCSIO 12610]|uniref:helix-turn-helix domain-containing protein n=1 Tax=Kordiimonas sp. SCSIO 12610 TaxID=2829597 RepID=UPI00210A0705|nr:AraC family transcriptional regulator [Kordiimonas sp. SCSIO 12610]UTW54661.1 helix-turn-helix transcriptional regulator [Kordiimonas sp. SCSIO 12610]
MQIGQADTYPMNPIFLSVLYFIAFSHAFMLSVVLWRKTETGGSGKLLSLVIAILAYKMFEAGSEYSGLYRYAAHLMNLMPLMVLVLGPVFYAYVRKMTGQLSFSRPLWLLHLLPWITFWLYFNTGAVFRPLASKVAMYDGFAANVGGNGLLPVQTVLILVAVKIHLAIYLYLSWNGLTVFARSVQHIRSDNSRDILKQLRMLAVAFVLLESVWVSLFLGQQYAGLGTLNQVSQVWLLFIAIIVLGMGFTGLSYPNIIFTKEERLITEMDGVRDFRQEPSHLNNGKVKYLHSALPESTSDEIAQMIEAALEEEKLYLNDKLTLTDLAKHIDMKSHMVSQVINQGMNTNFYKLVNSYRVQHAASLLEDETINWPIERVALEAGFSNRVTFNKAFKEQMQCTASQYKKRQTKAIVQR